MFKLRPSVSLFIQWGAFMPRGEEAAAYVITVGNELLIGRTINTNAAWLGRRLTLLGFRVVRMLTVPDDVDEIAEAVTEGVSRARVVITTGGLGPTYDDVTLEGVARALGRRLVLNDAALQMVKSFYEKVDGKITEERIKMAMLPEGAKPLRNPVGAAPGSLVECGGRVVASLPGVPREMESMFLEELEPILRRLAPPVSIVECGVTIKGVPESLLAPYIKKAAKSSSRVYVKSHPKGSEAGAPIIEVKAMASAPSRSSASSLARNALLIVIEGARSLGGEVVEEDCS